MKPEMPDQNEKTTSRVVRPQMGFLNSDIAASPGPKGVNYRLLREFRHSNELVRPAKSGQPISEVAPLGGEFFATGTKSSVNFAIDLGTRWSYEFETEPVNPGGTLYDLALFGGYIYCCGTFEIEGASTYTLIRSNGGAWEGVTGHNLSDIYALLVFGGALYLGGTRATAGDTVQSYDGATFTDAAGARGILTCYVMYEFAGDLYAGGESAPLDGYNSIQMLDAGSWVALGTGVQDGASPGVVRDMCEFGGELVVVGSFDDADGTAVDNMASWDGGAFSGLGGGIGTGGTDTVFACCVFLEELYAGGTFAYLYKLESGVFGEVGESLSTYLTVGSTQIRTLCVHPNGEELIVGGIFQVRDAAVYGQSPCLEIVRYKFIEADSWLPLTEYAVGDMIRPTAGGVYNYFCTVAGTSGSTEPSWPTTIGGTVADGTCEWVCAFAYNYADFYGGVGTNPANISVPVAASSVLKIRALTPPGDTEDRLCMVGEFMVTNQIYSRLIANMRTTGYAALGKGLRLAGSYGGNVRVILVHDGGFLIAGHFDTAMNNPDKGDATVMSVSNVVQFDVDGFISAGGRAGEQFGGCVFGGLPYLCCDAGYQTVGRRDDTGTGADLWQAGHAYEVWEVVRPTVANGRQYVCIVAGTSGGTEPSWPTGLGGTVLDGGTVEWQCIETGWVTVGVNIESGNTFTLASFADLLWVGGQYRVFGDATEYVYGTSSGEKNTAGNWTPGLITDVVSIQKFCIGDYGDGSRLLAACVNITTGCVQVSSGGAFSELGGVGNRVSGEARDVAIWSRADGTKVVVTCGNLTVNGTDCAIAIYEGGTWAVLLAPADLLGQVTCLGAWVKERYGFLAGGDFNLIEDLPAYNLVAYRDGDGFSYLRGASNIGGASSPTRCIGSETTAG